MNILRAMQLQKVDHPEYETRYHVSKELEKRGIIIAEDTDLSPDKDTTSYDVTTNIYMFVSQGDTKHYFDIYYGDLLSNIQVYRIISDLLTIIENHEEEELLKVLRDLSGQYAHGTEEEYLFSEPYRVVTEALTTKQ